MLPLQHIASKPHERNYVTNDFCDTTGHINGCTEDTVRGMQVRRAAPGS